MRVDRVLSPSLILYQLLIQFSGSQRADLATLLTLKIQLKCHFQTSLGCVEDLPVSVPHITYPGPLPTFDPAVFWHTVCCRGCSRPHRGRTGRWARSGRQAGVRRGLLPPVFTVWHRRAVVQTSSATISWPGTWQRRRIVEEGRSSETTSQISD